MARDTGFTGVVSESLVQAATNDSMGPDHLDNQDGAASCETQTCSYASVLRPLWSNSGDESIAGRSRRSSRNQDTRDSDRVPHPGAFIWREQLSRRVLAGPLWAAGRSFIGSTPQLTWCDQYFAPGSIPQSSQGMLAGFRHIWKSDECRLTIGSIGDSKQL
jgi:hypothetical protein